MASCIKRYVASDSDFTLYRFRRCCGKIPIWWQEEETCSEEAAVCDDNGKVKVMRCDDMALY